MSQGSFLAPNISPKLVPNRIIDAEGIRKALDRHLGGYHRALRAILDALGAILSALEGYKMAQRRDYTLRRSNNRATTACGEGGGEDKPLPGTGDRRFRFEENLTNCLHALRPGGLGGLREAEGVYD